MTSCKDTIPPGTPDAEMWEAETAKETAEAETAEATAEATKPRKPANKAKAAGKATSCKTGQTKKTLIISYGNSVLSATLSIFVLCITQLQTHDLMKGRGQPPLTIHL